MQAGFTPVEAIRIATLNGATYMGKAASIGSISPGKDADIVVLAETRWRRLKTLRRLSWSSKDGVGFDPVKLIQSVSGVVGLR